MFGDPVVEEYVRRSAGRARDTLRHRRIVVGHDIRPARSDDVGSEKRLDEKRQPVAIGTRVGVGIREDVPGRRRKADVARAAEAGVRRVDHLDARVRAGDLARPIFRSVVDENDFVVGVRQPVERRKTVFERVRGVVRADDHRDFRPGSLHFSGELRILEGAGNGGRGRLQSALAIHEPELPVLDRTSSAPPLVGPGECDRAAGTLLECRADMHGCDRRLSFFALTKAVGARLGEEQRLVAGDVLKAREIRAQLVRAVQIHVEGADVEKRQVEELGRGEVDVGEEAVGRRRLRLFVEHTQKPLDACPSVPPHDAGRNLVAKRESEDGRMIAKFRNLRDQCPPNLTPERAVVEEGDVLRPREADHDAKTVLGRLVEQFAARRGIRADGIDAERCHQTEVFGDPRGTGELVAVGVRRKRAVRHALDEKTVLAKSQEFAVRRDPLGQGIGPSTADLAVGLNRCAHNK